MSVMSVLILLLSTHAGTSVRVFSLQTDIWTPPSTDIYLRTQLKGPGQRGTSKNDSKGLQDTPTAPGDTLSAPRKPLDALTTCLRLRPTGFVQEETFVSYALPGAPNSFLMYRRGWTFRVLLMYSRLDGLDAFHSRLEPGVWNHYCLELTNGGYALYIEGVRELRVQQPLPLDELDMDGMMVLGQEQDYFGGGFVQEEMFLGSIAQVNLWSRLLSLKEIEDLARCKVELHGDIFSLDLDDVENSGALEESLSLEELCVRGEKTILYPKPLTFGQSTEFCEKTGGVLYVPTCTASQRFHNESLAFLSQCPGSFWVGVTDEDEEGVWRVAGSGEIATTCFTLPPNGKEEENCVSLRLENGVWDDRSCHNPVRCFSCANPETRPLILRGLCFETPERRFVEVLGYKNSWKFLHGYFGFVIYAETNGMWKIFDIAQNKTSAMGYPEADHGYPVGRMQWRAGLTACGFKKDQEIELSLSICNESEITCKDGNCVPKSARCDGRYQCHDFSDEHACSLITFPDGYRNQIPPEPLNPKVPQPISTTITFLRFLNIEDTKYSITMEFILAISWKDGRLSYLNLRGDHNDNKVSGDERERVWRPTVKFTNVLDGNVRTVDGQLTVKRTGRPLDRHYNEVSMDTVYPGWSGLLVDSKHISGTFDCFFDLYHYPFDTQRCAVRLRFGRDLGGQLRAGQVNRTRVTYGGAAALPSHVVDNFTVSSFEGTEGTTLEVHFTLKRRPKLLMIKLFIPSFLLLVVGYLTLYIPRHLVQARLVLSLTTKLVLYTLFSQASSSLPSTAYVKLIDIWFFFSICTLFFIILVHVLVEHLPQLKEGKDGGKVGRKDGAVGVEGKARRESLGGKVMAWEGRIAGSGGMVRAWEGKRSASGGGKHVGGKPGETEGLRGAWSGKEGISEGGGGGDAREMVRGMDDVGNERGVMRETAENREGVGQMINVWEEAGNKVTAGDTTGMAGQDEDGEGQGRASDEVKEAQIGVWEVRDEGMKEQLTSEGNKQHIVTPGCDELQPGQEQWRSGQVRGREGGSGQVKKWRRKSGQVRTWEEKTGRSRDGMEGQDRSGDGSGNHWG